MNQPRKIRTLRGQSSDIRTPDSVPDYTIARVASDSETKNKVLKFRGGSWRVLRAPRSCTPRRQVRDDRLSSASELEVGDRDPEPIRMLWFSGQEPFWFGTVRRRLCPVAVQNRFRTWILVGQNCVERIFPANDIATTDDTDSSDVRSNVDSSGKS